MAISQLLVNIICSCLRLISALEGTNSFGIWTDEF